MIIIIVIIFHCIKNITHIKQTKRNKKVVKALNKYEVEIIIK